MKTAKPATPAAQRMDEQNPPANQRILVIDDTVGIHEDIRKTLHAGTDEHAKLESAETALFGETAATSRNRRRFEIDSAHQGEEGLAMVERAVRNGRPYAMAFVDVRMPPGWDGIETTTRIWAVDPEIQIVICTAFSDYSWDDMIAKIGHSDRMLILKKPFDSMEVMQMAHALTEKWRLQRAIRSKLEHLENSARALEEKIKHLEAELAGKRPRKKSP